MNISDLLLVSDMDGTACEIRYGIPPENIEAARRFTGKGGRFTFATGRTHRMAELVFRHFPVNAPMIFLNGTLLYDPKTDRLLREHTMPDEVFDIARDLTDRLRGRAGVMLVQGSDYFAVSADPEALAICKTHTLAAAAFCAVSEVSGPIYKILVLAPDADAAAALRSELGEAYGARCTVVRSGERLVELLTPGVSKGGALAELCALEGIDRRRVVAFGDNENDLEMLAFAGLSAAPAGADAPVRAAVDRVLCPCMDGALARLIEHLESVCEA